MSPSLPSLPSPVFTSSIGTSGEETGGPTGWWDCSSAVGTFNFKSRARQGTISSQEEQTEVWMCPSSRDVEMETFVGTSQYLHKILIITANHFLQPATWLGCTVNITMTDEQYFSNLYKLKLRSHNDKFGIFLYLKISGRSVEFNIEILHTMMMMIYCQYFSRRP